MLSAAAAAVALQMGQVLQPRGDAGPVERVRAPRQHKATLAVLVLRQAYHAPVIIIFFTIAGRRLLIINIVVRDVGAALRSTTARRLRQRRKQATASIARTRSAEPNMSVRAT
jgi:hypothetical protein